jgi:multidrug efflux pump subunit AcrA (membrane-fusion protein)
VSGFLDRLRSMWDDLNDRERRLFLVMGAVLCAFVLGFPLFWTARENAQIESDNDDLRAALALLSEKRTELEQFAAARRSASQRYARRTPPLGSFIEDEARQQNLSIREVTSQPDKSVGEKYLRRSVTATINETGLTGIINLLSAIAQSPSPVAVESIQLEHYQPGDSYRAKIGLVTFDKKESPKSSEGEKKASATEASADEG